LTHCDRQCSIQYRFDFIIRERFGFARPDFFGDLHTPAKERVVRDEPLVDRPPKYGPGRPDPYIGNRCGGPLGVHKSISPALHLIGQHCCRAHIREIVLQAQKHGAPSIDRRASGFGLLYPSFKQHP
jgi:hypothetical protein